MANLKEIAKPVAKEIKEFDTYFASSMKSNVPLLSHIAKFIIRRKGKQLRPLLVFLSAKMMGSITNSTFIAAALIELLHTASLIHDDVVDEAYERRGFFSLNALWKSKLSVLMGDFLLAKGLLLSLENNEFELLEIVTKAVKDMSEAEIYQIQKTRKLNITEDEYFEIIKKKTAALFAACTECGGSSVSANKDDIQKLHLFGQYAGMAFQIKDDLFDYQTKGNIGKPVANDIKEKKLTLPLIHALNTVSSSSRKRILQVIRRHNKNTVKVNEVIQLVINNGGIQYAIDKMLEYKNKAEELLNKFPDNEAKKSMKQLLSYIVERQK